MARSSTRQRCRPPARFPVGTPMKPIEDGSLEMKYASGPFKIASYSPSRQLVLVVQQEL